MPDESTTDETTTTESTDDLGEAGKKALDAERAAARAATKRAKDLETELNTLRNATATEAEKALDAARKEAADATRAELGGALSKAQLEVAILRSVGTKFADPSDALQFIDPADVTNDDGTVDAKALTKAADDLLKTKPYLAATRIPGVPRGARGAESEADMNTLIRERMRR